MEVTGRITGAGINFATGKFQINLELNEREDATAGYERLKDCQLVSVKLLKHRNRRSLDANNYMWLLLSKMAPLLHTTKEELYLKELLMHGTFLYLPGNQEDEERLKAVFRIVIDRGEAVLTTQSGKKMQLRQFQCYKGSSLYNTLEMSHLIDGVVEDAKELGIETMTPEEIQEMKERWGIETVT